MLRSVFLFPSSGRDAATQSEAGIQLFPHPANDWQNGSSESRRGLLVIPLSMNDYIQQTGRAGRDGGKAHCILLYSSEDFWMASTLVEPYENARLNESLRQMMTYCEDREHCLKHLMLEALGQAAGKKCRFCTNCQAGRR